MSRSKEELSSQRKHAEYTQDHSKIFTDNLEVIHKDADFVIAGEPSLFNPEPIKSFGGLNYVCKDDDSITVSTSFGTLEKSQKADFNQLFKTNYFAQQDNKNKIKREPTIKEEEVSENNNIYGRPFK